MVTRVVTVHHRRVAAIMIIRKAALPKAMVRNNKATKVVMAHRAATATGRRTATTVARVATATRAIMVRHNTRADMVRKAAASVATETRLARAAAVLLTMAATREAITMATRAAWKETECVPRITTRKVLTAVMAACKAATLTEKAMSKVATA